MTATDLKMIIGICCVALAIANLLTAFWHACRGAGARMVLPTLNFVLLAALVQLGAFD